MRSYHRSHGNTRARAERPTILPVRNLVIPAVKNLSVPMRSIHYRLCRCEVCEQELVEALEMEGGISYVNTNANAKVCACQHPNTEVVLNLPHDLDGMIERKVCILCQNCKRAGLPQTSLHLGAGKRDLSYAV